MIDKIIQSKGIITSFEDSNRAQVQTTTASVAAESMPIKTKYDDNNDELKMKLMDKDRAIIEHIKTIKEQEKKLQALAKSSENLEEKNSLLLNEMNDLAIQLKHKENAINNHKEDIQILQTKTQSSLTQLQRENGRLSKTIEELKVKGILNEELIKRWIEENNKLSLALKHKDQIIEDNNALNEKNDNIIKQFKNDNKQILSLKRRLKEYEDIIAASKKDLRNIQAQYDIVAGEKEKIEFDLMQKTQKKMMRSLKNEDTAGKENNDRIAFDYQRIQKENEGLNKAKADLTLKVQTIQCDYESFVNNLVIQIGKIANDIETDIIKESTPFPSKKISMKNETVGDLIQKSISLLNQSITSKLQSNKQQLDTLINSNNELEASNQELINDKSSLVKANTFLTAQNAQYSNKHNDQLKILNQISKDYGSVKDSYVNLKDAYKKLTQEIEMIGNQTHFFLNSLIEKLYPEGQTNDSPGLSISDKINQGIDAVIESNKQLLNKIDEFDRSQSIVLSKEKYDKLCNENKALTSELKYSKDVISSRESQLKKKEGEMVLKINELHNILKESNQLVSDYDNQLKDAKERNKKLESNLEMLTKSHYELEQEIGTNNAHTNEEHTSFESKYCALLLEMELKDIRIQSLEKLQLSERKIHNKPFIGKLLNKGIRRTKKTNDYYNTISTESELNHNQSGNLFIRNEEKERELEKMFIETKSTQENNKQAENSINPPSQIGKLQSNKTKSF